METGNALSTGLTWRKLAAIVVFSAITPMVMLAAPVIAGQLAMQLQLTPTQIGDLFSVELAAMSLATVAAWWWQSHWDWRWVARVSAVVFIVANLASMGAAQFSLLFWLRCISALGGGTLMVLSLSSAVASSNRDRTYALWVSGQLVLAALALWALPELFAQFGLQALYMALALLMVLAFPLTAAFPATAPSVLPQVVDGQERMTGRKQASVLLALAAVLLFYIGLIAVWAFVGMIADAAGIAVASLGQILSFATVMGIVGSLTAAWIGNRGARGLWLLLGYGLMAVSVALLFGMPGVWRFALSAIIFKYVWTFVLPYIISCIADMDRNGQLVNSMNLVIGAGLAIGPAIAGRMLQPDSSLGWMGISGMLTFSVGCLVISFALLLASRYCAMARHPRPHAAVAPQGV